MPEDVAQGRPGDLGRRDHDVLHLDDRLFRLEKYATALTRTGTLSFVITSCGGTFSVTVRRSTLTFLSMMGRRKIRPGPFGGVSRRPSRNTTPRSYSRGTRTEAASRIQRR